MKTKLKSFVVDNRFILITGAIATVIVSIIFMYYSITPFGDRTVLTSDLRGQYAFLLTEFHDKITSGESLLYSWTTNLGGYYLGTYFNYLSSPLNLLILLFKRENIAAAIGLLVALRAVLSAVSMAYYLKKSQKSNNAGIIAFGLMYGFCAYFFAYYFNIMWMDAMYLLPLIILGIEELIDGGKCTRYIFFLSLAIYSNYYIGFMLCIFSCIYFVYYYICSLHKFKRNQDLIEEKQTLVEKIKKSILLKRGIKFALSSLCVGVILSLMIISFVNVLTSISATSGDKEYEFKFYFNVFDFFANHLTALKPSLVFWESDETIPNVACGMLTLLLFPIYLLSKEIKLHEKIGSILFAVFMFFSFNTSYLDALWHAGSLPNGFTQRQSFMYSFLLVVIAFKVFKNIDKTPKKLILASGIGVTLFVALVWIFDSPQVEERTPIISLIFAVVYTIILVLTDNPKVRPIILSSVLVASVAVEMLMNIVPGYVPSGKAEVMYDYDAFEEIHSKIEEQEDLAFYREELTCDRETMISCLYDFNGISIFNSMSNTNVCKFQSDLGIYSNSKFYAIDYFSQTPVYNAMFALRYIYDKGYVVNAGEYYDAKYSGDTFFALKNKYALTLAYPVQEAVAEWNTADYADAVEAQEEYFRLATGVDNVYNRTTNYKITYENVVGLENYEEMKSDGRFRFAKKSTSEESTVKIEITAENTDNIYVYVQSEDLGFAHVTSSHMDREFNTDPGCLGDLGSYREGEVINIEYTVSEDGNPAEMDLIVFTVNKDAFVEGYKKLKDGQLSYTEVDDTTIKGTFVAEENEILYTSIPYDKAWNVYIDGEKVDDEDIIEISNALLGVKSISAGEHEIVFEYKNIGIGACVSVPIAVMLILAILYIMKRKGLLVFKNKNDNLSNEEPKENL